MPSVPLAGPSSGSPTYEGQLGNFLRRERRVKIATVHAYPLKHCVATNHVTIGELLANSSSDGLAANVAPLAAIAHAHHLPLRIDEINAISCGGERGVSDTYATALWSLDALFALAHAGVDGVNIHTPPRSNNQMFTVTQTNGVWRGVRAPRLLRDADVRPGNAARLASGAGQRHVGGGAVELGDAGSRRPHTRGRDQQEHAHARGR